MRRTKHHSHNQQYSCIYMEVIIGPCIAHNLLLLLSNDSFIITSKLVLVAYIPKCIELSPPQPIRMSLRRSLRTNLGINRSEEESACMRISDAYYLEARRWKPNRRRAGRRPSQESLRQDERSSESLLNVSGISYISNILILQIQKRTTKSS